MTDNEKLIEQLHEEVKRLREELEQERQEKDRIVQEKETITQEKERILRENEKIIHEIVAEKEKIVEEKEKIMKEFEEFKAKHKTTVAHLQKAMNIRPDKSTRKKKLGAPVGHKGYTRRIPERIDFIKVLNPCRCPDCKTPLGATQEVRFRYVTDIKLISKTKTTKYAIHRKYCIKCKKIVEQSVPNALPYARFGINIMLLVMYLRLGLRLPTNKVCEYFLTLYNLSISNGEITHILKQLAREFGPYYKHLLKVIKLARVKHSDTTSWRIDGKNYHAWVFVAVGVVLYHVSKRNNHKVALKLLGRKQKGMVLVVDRHSAFRTLAEKAGFLLQLCWSHILQDAKELKRGFGREGAYVLRELKNIYELAKGLEGKGTPEQVQQLQAMILELTQRHYKSTTIRRFVNNLWTRDIENLFRFVTDSEIDPTNNISERELRALVIIRKISNGSRSKTGAHLTTTLLSIIQTLRLKNQNVLKGLKDILNNPLPTSTN